MTPKTVIAEHAAALWKWAFGTVLALVISLGSYAFTQAEGRIQKLEDARVPVAVAEAQLRAEIVALRESNQRLDQAVRELNQRLDLLLRPPLLKP